MTRNLQQKIFSEAADFLVSQPMLEAIAAYKVSFEVQQHIDHRLDKNWEVGLSPDERLEIDKIMVIIDVLDLTKAKARLKLSSR